MADKTSKIIKTKKKRLSKSQRTHVRRLKQEARKMGPVQSLHCLPRCAYRDYAQAYGNN